jgi:PAS domain S-box-containing protein
VTKDPRFRRGNAAVRGEYAVPLRLGASVLGVLDVESDRVDGIRAVTRKLVDQVATQVAAGLQRSDLFKKLQASEERFRSIFEQSQIGVKLADLEGKVIAANPGYERILGYGRGELLGVHFSQFVHPEDVQLALSKARDLMQGKLDTFQLEARALRKSGESVWCAVTVSLIRDSSGRPLHTLTMLEDISGRKKAEEERAQLQEQLFHVRKMMALGTLAGGVAHDFNNLLGVILGYTSLLRRRLPSGHPAREPLDLIEKSAQRGAELTSQLLQLARQETHRVEHLDVGEVVAQALRIVTETFDRRIRIETHLAADLPCIAGDPGQLELALLNLCINARDAMPAGGTLTIETSLVNPGSEQGAVPADSSPGEYVRIAVKDTGVGMEPELLQRIFEPFFTTKEPGKGSGLGLATVNSIANRHGGFVRAASQIGRGSEFSLYLPVSRPVQPLAEAPPLSRRTEPKVGTVLVVDDEPFMLAFAEEALQELGYQALTAESGKQACEIYAQRAAEIDCVLLDMVLPGKSGLETQQALRTVNPEVKVVLVSGYSGGAEVERARAAGATAFLAKPYTVETLAHVLKNVLEGSDAGKGGAA